MKLVELATFLVSALLEAMLYRGTLKSPKVSGLGDTHHCEDETSSTSGDVKLTISTNRLIFVKIFSYSKLLLDLASSKITRSGLR